MDSFEIEGSSSDDYKLRKGLGSGSEDDVTVVPASDDDGTPSAIILDKKKNRNVFGEAAELPASAKIINGVQGSFNVTSTPLMSTSRRTPLSNLDLDITAIPEENDSNHVNFTFHSPAPVRARKDYVRVSNSSEDEGEDLFMGKENRKGTTGTHGQKNTGLNNLGHKDEIIDLAQSVKKLNIQGHKKGFQFKPTSTKNQKVPIPDTINIDSNDEDEEFFSVEEVADLSDTPKRRIKPEPPKRVDFKERRPEIIPAKPLPPLGSALVRAKDDFKMPSAEVLSFRSDVKKAIKHLAETIHDIPEESARAACPPGLKVPLYDHQSYGLEWLFWRESQYPGGGILADEMGLGKTIMIIALILRSKSEKRPAPSLSGNSLWKTSERSKLVPSSTTLVVVPASVMDQWADEIRMKAPKLKVAIFHGPKRTSSAAVLAQNDVVITTYQTVGSEIPKEREGGYKSSKSPLERLCWERIVIDEGHIIRNSGTNCASAVCKLEAQYRWVVTGTPVHNKAADMHSLVKFLRLAPFDDAKVWDYWIGLKLVSSSNAERLNTIGKSIILRRTKQEVKDIGGNAGSIPPKVCEDIEIEMTDAERQVYGHLMQYAESQFRMFLKNQEDALQHRADNYVAGRRAAAERSPNDVAFVNVFVLLLRLRQLSVLPHLTSQMLEEDDCEDLDSEDFDPMNQADVISRKNPIFAEDFVSSKLDHLFKDLDRIKKQCKAEGRPVDKVVIVSQWTTLLKIVANHLNKQGYSMATISGEVPVKDRGDIMKRFNNPTKRPQILLLSLNAGGVGLNLTGGNHMFFLDIHYNPQLELQAQDRIHRFGQTKNVFIHRYVCKGTMEEQVLKLQKSKMELADGLLSNTKKKSGGGLSIQDMRKLFGF